MAIFYINTDFVCLVDDNFKDIYYCVKKTDIDINELTEICKKKNVKDITVIINSFFALSEIVSLRGVADKKSFKELLDKKTVARNVLFWNYNSIFSKSGLDFKNLGDNDKIALTTIKGDKSEQHIEQIVNFINTNDFNVNGVLCYTQTTNAIGETEKTSRVDVIRICIVVLTDEIVVNVSNGGNFIFGRVIKKKENETINQSIALATAMTYRYIQLVYEDFSGTVLVEIFSAEEIKLSSITEIDPFLKEINITVNTFEAFNTEKFKDIPVSLAQELSVVYLVRNKLKNVNKLINEDISRNQLLHKIIKFMFIGIFALVGAVAVVLGITDINNRLLNTKIEKIEKDISILQGVADRQEKQLSNISNSYTPNAVGKLDDLAIDIRYKYIINISGKVLNAYGMFFDAYGYNLYCLNCLKKEKVWLFTIDTIFYNASGSRSVAYDKLKRFEGDLKKNLSKYCSKIEVFLEGAKDENDIILTQNDIEIKVNVICTNDNSYKLPETLEELKVLSFQSQMKNEKAQVQDGNDNTNEEEAM